MSSARPPGQTRRLVPPGNIGRGKQASAGGRAIGGRKSTEDGCRGTSSHQRVNKKEEEKNIREGPWLSASKPQGCEVG